jgi:putrescine transport system permease protein
MISSLINSLMGSLMGLMRLHLSKFWLCAVFSFLYAPLLFLVVFSFNSTRQDAAFTGFSTRWYAALANDPRLVDGFLLSLKIALISATLATVLATLAAYALVRLGKFRGRTFFSGMVNSPLVMPEVIIGMSLLLLMAGTQRVIGWPDRGMLTIIFGHILLGMAYATVVMQSRLLEMDRSLEEAAMDLGCRPGQVFFLVTLPNIVPALIAAWLLTFTLSFDDVVISEFLSGPGVTTLPQVIFSYARRGVNPSIYAAATLLMMVITVTVIAYSVYAAKVAKRLSKNQKSL